MSIHVGELTSQVEVTGVAAGAPQTAGQATKPPEWQQRQRFADLAEEQVRSRARTAAGGFDG